MSFLAQAELNERFRTEGAFYQIELDNVSYSCRGVARICRRGKDTEIADALVVMVNPGSCQPKNRNYQFPNLRNGVAEIPFVEANADQTQHQLMRLMERRGWNMLYIINLSDLCAGNINDFKEQLNTFEERQEDSHSIFSEKRKKAISALVSDKTTIIAGWGTQPFIKRRAFQAISILEQTGVIRGLPHNTKPYYYHPYPYIQHKCIKWINDMCEALEEEGYDEAKVFPV